MNGYEYCEYWIKKYKKSIKTLRSIGFPMELFVSMAGVFIFFFIVLLQSFQIIFRPPFIRNGGFFILDVVDVIGHKKRRKQLRLSIFCGPDGTNIYLIYSDLQLFKVNVFWVRADYSVYSG